MIVSSDEILCILIDYNQVLHVFQPGSHCMASRANADVKPATSEDVLSDEILCILTKFYVFFNLDLIGVKG